MNRTLRDQLKIWKDVKQEVSRKPQKRRREVLTESDIKYLMGMDKPVFRKYRGSFRQR